MMANNGKIQQILSNIQALSDLTNSMKDAELYPVSFFSSAFDLVQNIQSDFHRLEADQVNMFTEQMKKHQDLILSIHKQMRNLDEIEAPVVPKKDMLKRSTITLPEPTSDSILSLSGNAAKPAPVIEKRQEPPPPPPPPMLIEDITPPAPPTLLIEDIPPPPPLPEPILIEDIPPPPPLPEPMLIKDIPPLPEPLLIEEIPPPPPLPEPLLIEELPPPPPQEPEPLFIEDIPSPPPPPEPLLIEDIAPPIILNQITTERIAPPSLNDVIEKNKLSDLRKAFSLNDRFRYRRELFENNEDIMNNALLQLNKKESLNESLAYLQDTLHLDFNTPTVKDFIKILEIRFL